MSVEQQLETWQRRTEQQYRQLKRLIASDGRDHRERLEELEHDRTAQQVQIDAYALEGSKDRIALEELVARVERLERDLERRLEWLEQDLAGDGWVRLSERRGLRLCDWLMQYARTGDLDALHGKLREDWLETHRVIVEGES